MPEINNTPAYLRYLRARLSNLLRPGFWVTGIFLIVVVLLVREYWLNPGIFTQNENQKTDQEVVNPKSTEENTKKTTQETTLSEEDKAIAADIDNMPNLLSDVVQSTVYANTIILPSNAQANNKETFLEDIINQRNTNANLAKSNPRLEIVNQVSPVNAISTKNPFLVQAENLLQSNTNNNRNQFLGINNFATSSATTQPNTAANLVMGLNNQTLNNQHTLVVSPLAAAIKQSINTTQISSSGNNVGVSPNYNYHSLPSNSSIGYGQPNYYSNFNTVQTKPNVGIPTMGIYGLPQNPNYVQSPNQSVINSNTP
ncbi:hypothetical protein [Anabaena sp. UHCC 0451]|uniref:hypothetical protein n=1 Tax=Anabaena sp. UHCC 0451 TaxID=2055235 RepID=UPI002B1FF150|nr:hypothetical protein [Anabaena sp. UHCC 0451]MEA5577969.1 hypothetical protein [Anabaena sp. UHCC 0451]